MPPGIPAHMAGVITTPRTSVAGPAAQRSPARPTRPLHPTFAGADAARRQNRQNAEALRQTAQNAALATGNLVQDLTGLLATANASPEAKAAAEAEGLDLVLLAEFTAKLKAAVDLTAPPETQTEPPPGA